MEGYREVDDNLHPGDYLKYMDEWGKMVGCGALVSIVVHPVCPRTKSHYVLKNISSGATWQVNSRRYSFFYKRAQNGAMARSERFRSAMLDMLAGASSDT